MKGEFHDTQPWEIQPAFFVWKVAFQRELGCELAYHMQMAKSSQKRQWKMDEVDLFFLLQQYLKNNVV